MASISRVFFFILVLLAGAARADVDFSARGLEKTEVGNLRPTQGAVGYHALAKDREEFERMSKDERWKALEKKPVPVVVGPGGEYFMIDRHHQTRALLESGHHKLYVRIVADWSDANREIFWKRMQDKNYVWLFDERGRAIEPGQLPLRVEDLKDDPYRSLATYAREAGAFRDTAILYAEFQWANYYRRHIPAREFNRLSWKKLVERAVELSGRWDARGLPGYKRGGRCAKVF